MPLSIETGLALIVDDVELNRILARAYLESLGWVVDECSGGYAALAYMQQRIPELILMDIRMPGLDGNGVAQVVRQTWPVGTVKLVAYTAHAMLGELQHIRAAGFDEVMIKPVSLADFERIIGVRKQGLSQGSGGI